MRGEVQQPGTVAPGHDEYESGLRDRSVDLDWTCTPTLYCNATYALAGPFSSSMFGFVSKSEPLGDSGIFSGGLQYCPGRGLADA